MFVVNNRPSLTVDNALVTSDEGQIVQNSGSFDDLDLSDTSSITASVGSVVHDVGNSGNWSWTFDTTDGPDDSQTVTITATDSNGAVTTTTFSLVVNNLAPIAEDASFDVIENSTNGTSVGVFVASDPGADTLMYGISGGTGTGVLAIDSATGEITVVDVTQLDYETTPILSLEVTVTDDDGATSTADVTINLLNQASIAGTVFVDTNENGLYEANEMGIDGVIVELLDELGLPVVDESGLPVTAATSDGGFYFFEDLDPGAYLVHELQPSGVDDGAEQLGTIEGETAGSIVANDTMQLSLDRFDANDYVFAEIGQQLTSGDTAGIGFWQNKHGQNLIRQGGTALADWLTGNFGNIFGDSLEDSNGDDIASFYKDQLFKQKGKKVAGPAKVDAQFMAVAMATFFTSRNIAGSDVAVSFGFHVTDTGIGTKIVNVGSNGAAVRCGRRCRAHYHAVALGNRQSDRHAGQPEWVHAYLRSRRKRRDRLHRSHVAGDG